MFVKVKESRKSVRQRGSCENTVSRKKEMPRSRTATLQAVKGTVTVGFWSGVKAEH